MSTLQIFDGTILFSTKNRQQGLKNIAQPIKAKLSTKRKAGSINVMHVLSYRFIA